MNEDRILIIDKEPEGEGGVIDIARQRRAIPNPKKDRDVRLQRESVCVKKKKGWTGMDQVK